MTFNEIESFYRSYFECKTRLTELTEEKERVIGAVSSKNKKSVVEDKVLEKIQLESTIKMVEKCLNEMTKDEKNFIGLRYFLKREFDEIAIKMKWSERELYRLRKSVLTKTLWFLSNDKWRYPIYEEHPKLDCCLIKWI